MILLAVEGLLHSYAENRVNELLLRAGILENYNVRNALAAEMIKPADSIMPRKDLYLYVSDGQKVLFKTYVQQGVVFYLFINQTPEGYPEAARGNYLIKRNTTANRFDFIKVFFRNEEGCYAEIMPRGRHAMMNIYLFNKKYYGDITLPVSIETCVTAPFANIIEMSNGTIEWETLIYTGVRMEDRRLEELIEKIRNEIHLLDEADDGAINADGKYVLISSGMPQKGKPGLNCSGFMKWIVDGFYFAATGGLMDIELLKKKHPNDRGTRWSERIEDARDSYFGLDWTRNCAIALASAQEIRSIEDYESKDVRFLPFLIYIEDVGYPMEYLKQILFYLAVKNPGKIYLGAINEVHDKGPLYVSYYHVVTFIPYFDKAGNFKIIVMDQHKDFLVESILKKYPTQYIHLVEINAATDFSPIMAQ